MPNVEEVKRATRELMKDGEEESLDYITQELLDEYETAFANRPAEQRISVLREDGSFGSEDEIPAEVGPETTTHTWYGNHVVRQATSLYWWTNAGGEMCGATRRVQVWGWVSANWYVVRSCPGGFNGFRIVVTFG